MKKLLSLISAIIITLSITQHCIAQSSRFNNVAIELLKDNITVSIDPSNQFIMIKNNSGEKIDFITIQSSTGKIVLNAPYKNYENRQIDIRKLENGVYGLILKQNNKVLSRKFTKNRV